MPGRARARKRRFFVKNEKKSVARIKNDFVAQVCFRTASAVPLGLLAKAEKAAFLKDIKAHVTAKHEHRAVSLWARVGDRQAGLTGMYVQGFGPQLEDVRHCDAHHDWNDWKVP